MKRAQVYFRILTLLTMCMGMQQQAFAAKNVEKKHPQAVRHGHSSSSTHHHKKKNCCERVLDEVKSIEEAIEHGVNARCKKNGCERTHCLTQKDFNHSGCHSKPVVITESGKYTLCENVSFTPKHERSSAIVIDADDVILDLCGFTLSQGNDVLRTIGIEVITGHKNITILGSNGAIRNFSQLGLYVQGGNQDIQLGNDDSVLFITNNGGKSPTAFGEVGDAFFEGGAAIGETNYWVLTSGLGEYHGLIKQLRVQNVIVEENSPVGTYLGNGEDFSFNNCSFSRNFNNRLNGVWFFPGDFPEEGATTTFGLAHDSSLKQDDPGITGWIIEDCILNGNVADASQFPDAADSFVDGLQHETARDVTIRNTQFNDNTAIGAFRSTARGYGFGGGESIVVQDSQACGNKAGYWGQGIHQSGSLPHPDEDEPDGIREIYRTRSVTYERCVASNNIATPELRGPISNTNSFATGFVLAYTDGGSLIDCVAQNNKAIVSEEDLATVAGDAEAVFIVGGAVDFVPNVEAGNIVIRGLIASENSTNASIGNFGSCAVEIIDNFTQNVTIEDCVFMQNTDESELGSRIDAGVIIFGFDDSQPGAVEPLVTIINTEISNHRTAGVFAVGYPKTKVQGCEIKDNGVGVFLDSCSCSAILSNTFLNNILAVEDANTSTVNPSTSLLAYNQAFDNGIGSTGTTYDVWYTFGPAPTVSGDLVTAYPPLATVTGENVEWAGSCAPVPVSASKKRKQNQQKRAEYAMKERRLNPFFR